MENHPIKIEYLDHVAIRVKDLEISADWYAKVLGLKKFHSIKWGPWPIFMLSGKTGIALFPLKNKKDVSSTEHTSECTDHFAFMVNKPVLETAMEHLTLLNIKYEWQDHIYFHSIYFEDPDGHKLELTCFSDDDNPPY